MKTRYWIAMFTAVLLVCAMLSIPLLSAEDSAYAEIISEGQTIQIVDLTVDREILIAADNGGENTITVKDGKIGITAANCPDHYCMDRGMCSRGIQIVCLPNGLIIRFRGAQTVDSVSG